MNVPLLDLKKQHTPISEQLGAAFARVLESGQFILGPEVEGLERELAEFFSVEHVIGVSSGTDALLLALMALDIGPGDEVICPSFSFFATAGSIARCGAIPVFADVCPVCFNITDRAIQSRLTSRTKAIMPVHLFGQCASMDPILDIAKSNSLHVIEDAAQAIGACAGGEPAGTMGVFGAFSFFPSKNLGALGDAGLLITSNQDLATKARKLRVHGADNKYFHSLIGANFRLDALQAALLRVKLPHLTDYTTRRRANAERYLNALSQEPGVWLPSSSVPCHQASDQPEPEPTGAAVIVLPQIHEQNSHIWNQFTIRVLPGPKWTSSELPRDSMRALLARSGIASEIYYPLPLHRQLCFQQFSGAGVSLPVSERLARECLSIPISQNLSPEQQDSVIKAIKAFLSDVNR